MNDMDYDTAGIYFQRNNKTIFTPNDFMSKYSVLIEKKCTHIEKSRKMKTPMARNEAKATHDYKNIEKLRAKIKTIIKNNSNIICQAKTVKLSNRQDKSIRYQSPITICRKPKLELLVKEEVKEPRHSRINKRAAQKRTNIKIIFTRTPKPEIKSSEPTSLIENYGNKLT